VSVSPSTALGARLSAHAVGDVTTASSRTPSSMSRRGARKFASARARARGAIRQRLRRRGARRRRDARRRRPRPDAHSTQLAVVCQ
jgi:hypothetical protein